MTKPITILAIESSCDDTSAAVIKNDEIYSNVIASQAVHEKYGGVVPELASRAHQSNIIPTVESALKSAKISKEELDAIAFTNGPGLLGSLLVANAFTKGFAAGLNIPIIEVNHMQAHIMAHMIKEKDSKIPSYPFLCLTVSGGHTQIVLVESYDKMKVIGKTLDDAAGEAFDKSAKILGLPYPGGPLIDKYGKDGDPLRFEFPTPKIPGIDYSFSGIKTSFLYFIRDNKKDNDQFITENLNDICASIQHAIVKFLLQKLKRAVKETGINQVALAGGVSANSYLRKSLNKEAELNNWETFIPKFEYCTDNAAMIAITAYHKYLDKDFVGLDITPNARMKI